MNFNRWLSNKINKYFEEQKPKKASYLSNFDRVCLEIRCADVLLVEGVNRISKIIKRLSLSPWSHSALYIGRLHDIEDPLIRERIHSHYKGSPSDQLIIESVIGKGTIISNIKTYENNHVRICRAAGLAHTDAQRVIAFATKSLGREYHIMQILDLARFLLKSRFIPSRWRSSLFTDKPGRASRDICSTMIVKAFYSVKFPVLPVLREDQQHHLELIHRNPRLYTPSDFDYSPYFNIIKYPILSVTAPAYRNLPWNDSVISHDDSIFEERVNKKSSD